MPDENEDSQISQKQMPPSPTDALLAENDITEHEVVVLTVRRGMRYLVSWYYLPVLLYLYVSVGFNNRN